VIRYWNALATRFYYGASGFRQKANCQIFLGGAERCVIAVSISAHPA
jgi:hypothetical protein